MENLTLFDVVPETFYNTVDLPKEQARERAVKNGTQTKLILDFFRTNNGLFTPFEVQERLNLNAPITSVRRALTDLTDAGYLVKTEFKKPGIYGEMNYTWKLNNL